MGKRPWIVLAWGLYFLISLFVVGMVIGLLSMAVIMPNAAALANAEADPTRLIATLGIPFILIYLLAIAAGAFVVSIITVAVYRLVLRPEEGGVAWLKLGADEWRQFLVLLIQFLVFLGIYAVGFGLILALSLALKALGGFIGGLALFIALVFVGVRLSLAGPLTFDKRKVNVFGSWKLTQGRFWALFASYLIPGLILAGIVLAIGLVLAVLMGGATGLSALESEAADPSAMIASMAGLFGLMMLMYFVVFPVLEAFAQLVMNAPPAAAYKQLGVTSVVDAF